MLDTTTPTVATTEVIVVLFTCAQCDWPAKTSGLSPSVWGSRWMPSEWIGQSYIARHKKIFFWAYFELASN